MNGLGPYAQHTIVRFERVLRFSTRNRSGARAVAAIARRLARHRLTSDAKGTIMVREIPPVFDILEHENTTQALTRLGFKRTAYRSPGAPGFNAIIRIVDEQEMCVTRTVFDTNDWIRKGCPELGAGKWHEEVTP